VDAKALASKVGSALNNYSHTAIGASYAIGIACWHLYTHKDLGANFTAFSAYFYGFLLGHAGVNQKWPDRDGQQ
jgi:hypothetical protein